MMVHQALYPDYLCSEKKEEEDSVALKIAEMNQYEDSKTTLKKIKERFMTVAGNSTDNIITAEQNH